MGNILAGAMERQAKEQQQFMLELNQCTMERQIQMQNQMRERQAALQLARAREQIPWFGSFYVAALGGCVAGFKQSNSPKALAPLLPLTFLLAYQFDLAYGSKLARIRSEAENIIMFERDLVDMPAGLPTISQLDEGRIKQELEAKTRPAKYQ